MLGHASSGLPGRSSGGIPFPGPGLAIRIPGAITRERLDLLRKADAIFLEEIRAAGLYDAYLAGVRCIAAGAHGGRDGGRADLRSMRARCVPSPRPTG